MGGQWHQFSTVLVGWDLITGDTRAEMEIWQCTDRLAEAQIGIDEFAPKVANEFLVEGKFFAPGDRPVRAGFVEVEVGSACKRINVFGDRFWQDLGPVTTSFTEPEPVAQIQLDWAFAYGGEGYALNSLGKGFQRDQSIDAHPLPNLELDTEQLGDPNARPQPASFLPLRPDHPDRIKFAGTYGNDYVEKFFPGYPDDFHVEFFNRCPKDQRISDQLTDRTHFCLTHLHPSRPKIEGLIPDFQARVFFDESVEGREIFTEVPLNPDTVWFFPDKEMGVLVFHGSRRTSFHDTKNIANVVVGYERKSQGARPVSHYKQALDSRASDRKVELNYLLSGKDLIPLGEKTLLALFEQDEDERLRMFAADRAEKTVKKKTAEELDRLEKDIDEIEAKIPEQAEDIQEELRKTIKGQRDNVIELRNLVKGEKSERLSDAENRLSDSLERMTPRRADGSFDIEKLDLTSIDDVIEAANDIEFPEAPDYESAIQDGMRDAEKELEETIKDASPEIKDKARSQFAEVKEGFREGLDNPPKPTYPRPPGMAVLQSMDFKPNPEAVAQVKQDIDAAVEKAIREVREKAGGAAENELDELKSLAATAQEGIDNPSDEAKKFVEDIREELEPVAIEGDKAWHEGYVSYAHRLHDFIPPKTPDNQKLRLALGRSAAADALLLEDFAGCTLEDTAITGKSLNETYFEQSKLLGVQCSSSNLVGTIFAHALWDRCVFRTCSFEKANLGGMQVNACEFHDCSFDQTVLSETRFLNCQFFRCQFNHMLTENPQLAGCTFQECEFAGVMLIDSSVKETTVEHCEFERLTVRGGTWDKVDFADSKFFMTMWVESEMNRTSFRKCDLHRTLFQKDCALERLDFSNSRLRLVNISGLDLSSSVFRETVGELCDFSESVISNSVWLDVRLDSCRFSYSVLTDSEFNSVRFIDANLQDADLRGSRFSNCNLYSADLLHARVGDAHFSECEMGRTLLQDWAP